MLNNSWFKKEKPLLGLAGMGGGAGPLAGGAAQLEATGGTTSTYTDPNGDWKSHKFITSGSFV